MAEHVVEYYHFDYLRIIVTLDDGNRYLFDNGTRALRRLPTAKEMDNEKIHRREFAYVLREEMIHRGFNQKRLSEATGISQGMISKYYLGKASPTVFNLRQIAKALGCTIDDLVNPKY